jgi:hypothetical protein
MRLPKIFILSISFIFLLSTCQSQSIKVGEVVNGNYVITMNTDSIEVEWEKMVSGREIDNFSITQNLTEDNSVYYLLFAETVEDKIAAELSLSGGVFTFLRTNDNGQTTVACNCSGGNSAVIGCNPEKTKSGTYMCTSCGSNCSKTVTISFPNQ